MAEELGAERVARRVGLVAWAAVGVAVVVAIVLGLLAAVSELVLPLLFAVLLGIVLHPAGRALRRRGLPPAAASALLVLAVMATTAGVVLLVVHAVARESGTLAGLVDDAVGELAGDEDALDTLRDGLASVAAVLGRGLLTAAVGGVDAVVGFVGGTVLALLLMYYVLKDGPEIRAWMLDQLPERLRAEGAAFVGTAVASVRAYWAGRCVLSAVVTAVVVAVSAAFGLPLLGTVAVVNFVGGFVPYLGALVGGGLATILALAHGGPGPAVAVLAAVLAANLLLENLLEPRIMSGQLQIHPLLVLVATTTGGVVGGIVGLMLAVPVTVVGLDLGRRARAARIEGGSRVRS